MCRARAHVPRARSDAHSATTFRARSFTLLVYSIIGYMNRLRILCARAMSASLACAQGTAHTVAGRCFPTPCLPLHTIPLRFFMVISQVTLFEHPSPRFALGASVRRLLRGSKWRYSGGHGPSVLSAMRVIPLSLSAPRAQRAKASQVKGACRVWTHEHE